MRTLIKRLTSKTLLVNESGAIENFSPSSRATARDRPYSTRACQGDSSYSRGDPLRSPWPLKLTLMGITPTMDERNPWLSWHSGRPGRAIAAALHSLSHSPAKSTKGGTLRKRNMVTCYDNDMSLREQKSR